MASTRDWFEAAQARREAVARERELLDQLALQYEEDAQRLEDLLARTWRELTGYLLPDLEDEDLQAVEERLSYPSLRPIKRDYEKRIAEARRRREELGKLEEVAHHDILAQRLQDEMAEIAPARDAYALQKEAWDTAKWFLPLQKRGYFRHGYRPNGLSGRFSDWRAVSLLMAELEKAGLERFRDPDDVRARRRELEEEGLPVLAEHDHLAGRLAELDRLADEHADLADAPARLMQELYRALAEAIHEHIEACSTELRFELAREDPNLTTFFRKLAGLDKQVQYLRELATVRIRERADAMEQEVKKLDRKIAKRQRKAARGRFHATDAEIAAMSQVDYEKWQRKREKLDRLRARVASFDDYDRGSFGDHYLWWNTIGGGARGDDLYEVRDWRRQHASGVESHPHVRLEAGLRDESDAVGAAAVMMAQQMQQDGAAWTGDLS